MKPSVKTLGEILYAPSQYVIPVFQRNYRWEMPQWAKFWTSLIDIQSPEKRGNHFMGFLVFVPGLAQPGQFTTFHLIDGQQRLTTASLLLAAVRNVARRKNQSDLAEEIHNDYLVHLRKKMDQHYRLLPKKRDHDSYISILTGSGQATGRMVDALAYFEDQLASPGHESGDGLRQIFNVMCQRLEFMCATLEAENAYNIFKSLNSTGVALGPADLIRNFVFMHVLPDEHDQFDDELWGPLENRFSRTDGTLDEDRFSGFFRDFLMATGRYVPPRDTFATFETRYEATEFSPTDLARWLTLSSGHYAVIRGDVPDSDQRVTSALAGLNALESSTTYPVLLALFESRASGALSTDGLAKAIEMLRGFILRRFICGESSRGYGQMFVRALAKNAGDPLAALEAFLLERGWPDDKQFETAFAAFPLYDRGYKKEVLEGLERGRAHKEPADLEAAQVEHIMPRTLTEPWRKMLGSQSNQVHADCLHRPGNLTLSAYNQELWNHPFDVKRKRYADSNIVLTRELGNYARWSEEEIAERGLRLAKEAAGIWIGPKEPFVRPAPADEAEDLDRRELRLQFWTGLNDYLAADYPELQRVEARPNWTLRLASGIRHVGFDLRLGLRHGVVGIDIWFWRAVSRAVWERIRAAPAEYDSLIGTAWSFEPVEGRPRARMFVERAAGDMRNDSNWSELYAWYGEKLKVIYERVVPKLREEIDIAEASAEPEAREEAQDSDEAAETEPTGYWFMNVGDNTADSGRAWEDCKKYGFMGAGGGPHWLRAIKKLEPGDKLFAYASGAGYVGLGEVLTSAVPQREFIPPGQTKRLLDLPLNATPNPERLDDPKTSDWCVGVKWLSAVSREQGVLKDRARRGTVETIRKPDLVAALLKHFGPSPQK